MESHLIDLFKLILAIALGGVIGAEREFRDKAAGFRTIILITVGACLFTIFSIGIGGASNPDRIAANIVTGIGFLGAGAIIRDGGHVLGLTTAATIWLAAAIGMGVGAGQYSLSIIAAAGATVVLWLFPRFEKHIDNIRDTRTYHVTLPHPSDAARRVADRFPASGLRIEECHQAKTGDSVVCTWVVSGTPEDHDKVIKHLLDDGDVKEFKC